MLTECKFFVSLSRTFTGSYYEKFNIYCLNGHTIVKRSAKRNSKIYS